MRRFLAVAFSVVLIWTARTSVAQQLDAADLVSSWRLVALERGIAGGEATRVPGAQGLLIIDRAGYVFEFFSTASRELPASTRLDPPRMFADYGGFWGRYETVPASGRIDFEAEAGVSPNVRGLTFSRRYEIAGDKLVITSANEPQAQADTRWTWQRVPTVENLTPAFRQVAGFWRHIEERRVDTATGEVQSTRLRAPSVIVYTPGGFVGVHFPGVGREPFAGAAPTAEEAQAASGNYIGYFGALGLYPGEVSHYVLSGVSPSAGAMLFRKADITGDDLVVTLEPGILRPADAPPPVVTKVYLRRLSGVDDMLPRAP
jgi:hypothetical protein